jgi:hypothetical protein
MGVGVLVALHLVLMLTRRLLRKSGAGDKCQRKDDYLPFHSSFQALNMRANARARRTAMRRNRFQRLESQWRRIERVGNEAGAEARGRCNAMRTGRRRRGQLGCGEDGSAGAVLDTAIALIVAGTVRRAIVVVIDARGAVVMHGAEPDGHRGERAQRHERYQEKQQRRF